MEFQIRPTHTEDFKRLIHMFELCLRKGVDESYFQWKYLRNPSGSVVAFEAFEAENIAAFYGVIPELYVDGQETFTAYQSMDTMTHPDYQKRGLFVKLAKHTYAALQERTQSLLIIGVPGSNSFHGFVHKLNWQHLADIAYLFVHRIQFALSAVFKARAAVTINEISSFGEELKPFLERFYEEQSMVRPLYDVATLNWKVFQHPFKKFRALTILDNDDVCGLLIYSIEGDRAKIELADFWQSCPATVAIRAVISFIFNAHRHIKWVYTWEPTRQTLKIAYEKAGLIRNRFSKGPFSYKIPFIIYGTRFQGKDPVMLRGKFDLQPLIQD